MSCAIADSGHPLDTNVRFLEACRAIDGFVDHEFASYPHLDRDNIKQDAKIALVENWSSVETPKAYGREAARRIINRELRRAGNRRTAPAECLDSIPCCGDAELDKLCLLELRARVTSAIRKLPLQQRLIIVLKYFEGNSIQEIAEQIGLSERVVKQRLYRIRIHLHDQLSDLLYENEK